ncbi:uncharacterized protein LOC111883385 isoform X2 [Lactuca sativa]|nr:uncharacterized protein LOC111883385 isoform X2 [Lactuca sativa]
MKTCIPLYEASIKGDWKTAKEILDRKPELVRYSITGNGDTALHIAASAKSTKQSEDFLEHLLTYMENKDLELENSSSNTALCLAATAGNVKMVKIMAEKNRALVAITDSEGMTPLYKAALYGNYEVVKYLYENLGGNNWAPQHHSRLLLQCVENNMFDIALKIVKEHPELDSNGSVLGVLARKPDVFAETESDIFKRTFNWVIHPKLQAFEKESKAKALELLRIIWKNISEKRKIEIDDILRGPPDPPPPIMQGDIEKKPVEIWNTVKEPAATIWNNPNAVRKYSSRILFVAAEMGNTRYLVELIRQYPDLIWKVNDKNQSIFHIAVKHRHEGIYNLMYEIGSMKDLITPLKDENDNTMLHLVGKTAKKKQLEDVSRVVALQMQRELLWFKEVEKMIPPSYRKQKNKVGLTPHELFTEEHKELVRQGENWMKDKASQCMVVATLVATIVFAATFTAPGGYNQADVVPYFYRKGTFIVFAVADTISLFSSSTSVLLFLSILTSRYAERDFLESLPIKLMLGLATLFLSITTMMVALSVGFFVLYMKWITLLATLLATMPLLLFAMLQFPLLKDVTRSSYASRHLFRPKKHVLYYENSNSNSRRWFPFTFPFVSSCTSKIMKLL